MNKHLIVKRCRRLRRNQTESEKLFWERVRNRKINGLKFLRQHPFIYQVDKFKVYYFIADFYCADKKIIIELDGKIHDGQKEYDENRDSILRSLELKVMRFRTMKLKRRLSLSRVYNHLPGAFQCLERFFYWEAWFVGSSQ